MKEKTFFLNIVKTKVWMFQLHFSYGWLQNVLLSVQNSSYNPLTKQASIWADGNFSN